MVVFFTRYAEGTDEAGYYDDDGNYVYYAGGPTDEALQYDASNYNYNAAEHEPPYQDEGAQDEEEEKKEVQPPSPKSASAAKFTPPPPPQTPPPPSPSAMPVSDSRRHSQLSDQVKRKKK
jgi:hypothetical protein